MLSIIFFILLIAVFGEVLAFAIKMAWGITKIVFGVIVLPIILVVLAVCGLIYIAIPLLAIIGLISLFGLTTRRA